MTPLSQGKRGTATGEGIKKRVTLYQKGKRSTLSLFARIKKEKKCNKRESRAEKKFWLIAQRRKEKNLTGTNYNPAFKKRRKKRKRERCF